jgi:hypothetical protein
MDSHKQRETLPEITMKRVMNEELIRKQNVAFAGTGGRSEENRNLGFRPAFFDFGTQTIYLSRFANGRPAPFHTLDGLPEEVVVDRSPTGRVISAKATLISGFERSGFFYTRTAAARAAAEWTCREAD